MTNYGFPRFSSDDETVAGFFDGFARTIKKAVKNPVVMAAVPVVAVPAAFATQKPKNAIKSVSKGAVLSATTAANVYTGGGAGVAVNLAKSKNPIGDSKKIMATIKNPSVQRAVINTAKIAASGNKDAKGTLKLLAATKRAATKYPPKKPALRASKANGKRVTGVLIDSQGIVRRGSFSI